MADETAGLKPRPEFGEGIFEGPLPAEPEPGTPEFGARAKQRALNQSPEALTARSGLTPTPEELAGASELEAALTPEPPSAVTAGAPGAQLGDLDSMLKMFDVPAPALDTLLHDPNPPDPSDPEGDIIKRLTDSILGDQTQIPQARGFTPGEHLALGIMGALDGEVFQNVVLPMLMAEREAPRQAALDMEAQKAKRIQALQSLATLMSSRREHEATLAMQARAQGIDIAQMRMQAAEQNANRRLQLLLAQMRERSRSAAKSKVGDRVMGTYTLAVLAHQDAVQMKKLIDNNPGLGGFIAGSETARKLNLSSDALNQFSALSGTVNEAIMMITQRRGMNKETQKKIGGSLPDPTMGESSMRQAVETAIRTTGQFITGTEAQYPQVTSTKAQMLQLIDKSKGDADAINAIITDPESWLHTNGFGDAMYNGHDNGDIDLRLFRDDSEVP